MIKPRKLITLITAVALVVFLEGGARRAVASPQNQDQGQSSGQQGSFFVGHATRPLNVTGTRNETRSVNVHLWYPAPDPQNCQSGDGNSQGCPPSVYTSRLHGIPLLPQWDPLSWTIGTTQAFEELPINGAQSSYPVIIFSHGNQNNAVDYVYTLEALASFGYIVAAPDHVNNTQDDIRIDFIDKQAGSPLPFNFTDSPEGKPCFDDLSAPCEVLDRYIKDFGQDPPLDVPCPQVTSLTPPVAPPTQSARESMTDRVRDVSAIIDALPTWFGSRADTSRVGVMGHSRGTVTALAAAGGSKTCWGFDKESRIKAVMGLAIGARNITFAADVKDITVPTLLVAGSADRTAPASISNQAFNMLGTPANEKQFVLIQNAEHRHFDSGLCAQTQSSGAIAQANLTRAILDLQTIRTLVNTVATPNSAVAMAFCDYQTFTFPSNIVPLAETLSISKQFPNGFAITPNSVPSDGLDSDQVKAQVIQLAVAFFGRFL